MIIKSVHVQNLCGLLDATLTCDALTALVGGNGCGKSTFLRAVDLFYAPSPRLTQADFYDNDASREITITVTFTELNDRARTLFAPYLDGENLSVTRVISLNDSRLSAKYHGSRLQIPDFVSIRNAPGKREAKSLYDDLRQRPEYSSLPTVRSADDALSAIAAYEQQHPDRCERHRDDGQFFGFTAVAHGYLGRFTRFLLIPAVRDAGDDVAEGRGSPITDLLDLVVRGALANREELKALKLDIHQRYHQLMTPENLPELGQMQADLVATLQTFVPDAGVELTWSETGEIEIPMPRADVRLVEHGYPAAVANTGHGLQRAFILTMLHRLAVEHSARAGQQAASAATHDDADLFVPSLILGIEEPELYQHPNRQRHFAKILRNLATEAIPGVSQKTQVIYTTHSAHFVGLDRFDQVRVFRKVPNGESGPLVTRVIQVTGSAVADEIGSAWEPDREDHGFTWASVRPRLTPIMTPMLNEGFFSDTVVLVEGEADRALILSAGYILGYDMESQGISIIPCSGKANIDRPLAIFRQFGIKTFVVWDGDRGQEHGRHPNLRLLRLLGHDVVDYPPTTVTDTFACFEYTLGHTIKEEFGLAGYAEVVKECQTQQMIASHEDETKNPSVVGQLLPLAKERGLRSVTLERLIANILTMKATS